MISVLGTTNQYILQPSLMEMHHQSLEWLSYGVLWKRELSFFQKLLDKYASRFTELDDKKKIDHFQHIITYYKGEVVDALRKKLKTNEHKLAEMLQTLNESDVEYYKNHKSIMEEAETFAKTFNEFKHDFFEFIERVLH
jgi:DNA primase large subunit